jgi:hypothetical protein
MKLFDKVIIGKPESSEYLNLLNSTRCFEVQISNRSTVYIRKLDCPLSNGHLSDTFEIRVSNAI